MQVGADSLDRFPGGVLFVRLAPLASAELVRPAILQTVGVRGLASPTKRRYECATEICRHLDCLPLALELAAARLRTLDARTLLARLDRRLPLLTSGARDAPKRQETRRATIEWSYDLLDGELRDLFARIAVFVGTFTHDAAEAIADASVDTLGRLVEASLVKALPDGRFLMLETIRELALERLAERPDREGETGREQAVAISLEDAAAAVLQHHRRGDVRDIGP